ncbi:phage tail protein [Dichelobacter nodosus]|uniref:phage tail protein n=1 Tax=Dichelobacter nodosus TaxID=870 RepID=UPI00068327A5|nr:phage tail protein [Dichelobacter nodosus]
MDLLPPNSTDLERKLSQVLSCAVDLDADVIRGAKLENPPESWLDALIFEYGLNELSPYISNKRELIREGIAWQRIRGTPASVHIALSWAGLFAEIIESPPSIEHNADIDASRYRPHAHFAEYDLRLDRALARDEICTMIRLATLAQPVRSRLWRLVNGFDRSVFKLDNSLLSDAYLDDDSGWRPSRAQLPCLPDNLNGFDIPKFSFASQHSSYAQREESNTRVLVAMLVTYGYVITSWQAYMPYLDDLPEPMEVWQVSTGASTPSSLAIYYGQIWADQPWQNSSWKHTGTIITQAEQS